MAATVPGVLLTGVHGSRPSSGVSVGTLYSCTTHSLIYQTTDTGSTWVTWASLTGTGSVAADTIWDAAGDIAVGTGADAAARLAKGAAATVLVAGASTLSWVDILPWHVQIVPMLATADATTGTWALVTQSNASIKYFLHMPESATNSGASVMIGNSGGASPAVNDAWAIDVVLAAGTWDAHFFVAKAASCGIITLQQDGSDMGTVDTYAAAAAAATVSITGWAVATTGKKRMNLKMATKHASSTNYLLLLVGIEFRRTA